MRSVQLLQRMALPVTIRTVVVRRQARTGPWMTVALQMTGRGATGELRLLLRFDLSLLEVIVNFMARLHPTWMFLDEGPSMRRSGMQEQRLYPLRDGQKQKIRRFLVRVPRSGQKLLPSAGEEVLWIGLVSPVTIIEIIPRLLPPGMNAILGTTGTDDSVPKLQLIRGQHTNPLDH